MELEAEVQKLKEQNAELQKKQVYTMFYHFCMLKENFLPFVRKGVLITFARLANANCSSYFTDFGSITKGCLSL